MKKFSGIILIAVMLGVLLMTAGCSGTVKISDIQADPGKYEGEEVSVKGTVNDTFWISLLGAGAYQVDDGSGTIWVVTRQSPPDKTAKASAKGTVSTAVKIGDRSFGTVITETERK